MKRNLIIGTCLAASLAAGGIATASAAASGLPALYECAKLKKNATTKKYEGKYEKGCSKENAKGEGEYEIKEGFGKGKLFKAKGEGANLEVAGIGGIGCTKSSAVGKFNSSKSGDDVVATFSSCEFNGRKCVSEGQATGTIVTDALKGEVGYLEGKGTDTPKVGVAFTPESGILLASFTCGAFDFDVTGASIAEVSPVNTFSKEAHFSFKQKAVGVQEWQHFEEGSEQVLTVYDCQNCADPLTEAEIVAPADEELQITGKIEDLELKA